MTLAYSPKRQTMLWTAGELVSKLGIPVRTLRRRVNKARERSKREGHRRQPV
ncbi:hypothetical protein [Deinococcus terrestris]|uniref:hypothetical protein n=1 Tax=Deinococcus terrestris TaxID=2651870 RepID=UPI00188436EF|nr:hypothetical protein [Deinococcus terrestris]